MTMASGQTKNSFKLVMMLKLLGPSLPSSDASVAGWSDTTSDVGWSRLCVMADCGVHKKMEELFNSFGVKVVVDAAFRLESKNYLVRSAQQDPIGDSCGVLLNGAAIREAVV